VNPIGTFDLGGQKVQILAWSVRKRFMSGDHVKVMSRKLSSRVPRLLPSDATPAIDTRHYCPRTCVLRLFVISLLGPASRSSRRHTPAAAGIAIRVYRPSSGLACVLTLGTSLGFVCSIPSRTHVQTQHLRNILGMSRSSLRSWERSYVSLYLHTMHNTCCGFFFKSRG
jgi:hypothetical protein